MVVDPVLSLHPFAVTMTKAPDVALVLVALDLLFLQPLHRLFQGIVGIVQVLQHRAKGDEGEGVGANDGTTTGTESLDPSTIASGTATGTLTGTTTSGLGSVTPSTGIMLRKGGGVSSVEPKSLYQIVEQKSSSIASTS